MFFWKMFVGWISYTLLIMIIVVMAPFTMMRRAVITNYGPQVWDQYNPFKRRKR